jgi:hypothetical protein
VVNVYTTNTLLFWQFTLLVHEEELKIIAVDDQERVGDLRRLMIHFLSEMFLLTFVPFLTMLMLYNSIICDSRLATIEGQGISAGQRDNFGRNGSRLTLNSKAKTFNLSGRFQEGPNYFSFQLKCLGTNCFHCTDLAVRWLSYFNNFYIIQLFWSQIRLIEIFFYENNIDINQIQSLMRYNLFFTVSVLLSDCHDNLFILEMIEQ